jgi:hypothetical protein
MFKIEPHVRFYSNALIRRRKFAIFYAGFRGMIVAAGSAPSGPRAADRNIMDIADAQGIYRPCIWNGHAPPSTASAATLRHSSCPIPHQPSDIFGELVVSFTFTHIRTLWLGH